MKSIVKQSSTNTVRLQPLTYFYIKYVKMISHVFTTNDI